MNASSKTVVSSCSSLERAPMVVSSCSSLERAPMVVSSCVALSYVEEISTEDTWHTVIYPKNGKRNDKKKQAVSCKKSKPKPTQTFSASEQSALDDIYEKWPNMDSEKEYVGTDPEYWDWRKLRYIICDGH